MPNRCSSQTQTLWCSDKSTVVCRLPDVLSSGVCCSLWARGIHLDGFPFMLQGSASQRKVLGGWGRGEMMGSDTVHMGWKEIGMVVHLKWMFFCVWRSYCEECSLSLFEWNKETRSWEKLSEATSTQFQISPSSQEIINLMMFLSFFLFSNLNFQSGITSSPEFENFFTGDSVLINIKKMTSQLQGNKESRPSIILDRLYSDRLYFFHYW